LSSSLTPAPPRSVTRRLAPAFALAAVALLGEVLPGRAGQVALYPLLGAFPGLAVAGWLLARASAPARAIVGLALAPLVASIAGWAVMSAGLDAALAARLVGWLGWTLWALRSARPFPAATNDADALPGSRVVAVLVAVLIVAFAIPYALTPWMLEKSDAWYHAGATYQILERGMPPEDPRFAGLPVNYVWFFNLFVALLASVRDSDPFVFMALLNLADLAALAGVAFLLGWTLWRTRPAATGAAFLTCLGFYGLVSVLWPVTLARVALQGHPLPVFHWSSWQIMMDLSPPFNILESFVDKFVTGTSLNYAWVLMALGLWAVVRLALGPSRGAWCVLVLCSAGMQLWHGVVGLSAVPVLVCALLTALLARRWANWLPAPTRLASIGIAAALGFVVTLPYTLAISRGWSAERSGLHVAPFHFDVAFAVTAVASSALALALATRPLAAVVRERRGAAALLAIFAFGMLAFAIVVQLPNYNHAKFPFEAFVPLAALGGAGFWPWLDATRRRFGGWAVAVVWLALAAPIVLTLRAFAVDPEQHTYVPLNPRPGEGALYQWIRERTPRDMVFVDARFRDLVMVRGRRQMYLGSPSGPERAAFPLQQVIERRAVMADLYGPARQLDADADALTRLGRPACVIVRLEDVPEGANARASLAARPDRFVPIYERDGFVLYAVRMLKVSRAPEERRS
jgi:hypothetical protein